MHQFVPPLTKSCVVAEAARPRRRAAFHSRYLSLRSSDILCGRSRLSSSGAADTGELCGSLVDDCAQRSSRRSSCRNPEWWRTLHDRELDSLVERAIAASPTLEIALDRLQQARAQEAVVVGAALPAAGATAGGGWGSGSDLARGRASQTLVSAENGAGQAQVANIVGFDAAWEIDVFGKFRRAIEAAQYDVDAAVAARNLVLVSLIADVTRAYLDLRALQMQLAVLRKDIEVAQNTRFRQERFIADHQRT